MTDPIINVDVSFEDSDPGYKNFINHLTSDEAVHVDIGIHSVSGEELVMIASTHEFGTTEAGEFHDIEIPARPFIRSTVDERRETYGNVAKALMDKIIAKEETTFNALSKLGMLVESEIRMKIITLREPPNAPSTVLRKGSDNPLIDTGNMLNNVRYAVKTEKEEVLDMSPEGGVSYAGGKKTK